MSKARRRDEVPQPLLRLRLADKAARAAAHNIGAAVVFLLADRSRAADRTDMRKFVGFGILGPLFQHDAEDLRNDITRALQPHRIADANILAGDLVFVMQRRIGDDDAADGNGLKPRTGVSAPVRPTWISISRSTVVA